MVASAALGAAAVQTLHAQAKPPAYNIVEITIKDQDGYNKESSLRKFHCDYFPVMAGGGHCRAV
jgi:hypothetical protein